MKHNVSNGAGPALQQVRDQLDTGCRPNLQIHYSNLDNRAAPRREEAHGALPIRRKNRRPIPDNARSSARSNTGESSMRRILAMP